MKLLAAWALLTGCWLLVPVFRAALRSLWVPNASLRVRLRRSAFCASFLAGIPLLSALAVLLAVSLAVCTVGLFAQPIRLALELFR